jgi:HEAT repeat protein
VARVVNIATAAAPVHLIEKKPLPKALTFWTPLGVGALIVLFFGYKFTTDFMAGRKLQTWANSAAPSTPSSGDVNLLLGFMDDLDNGKIASQVLGKIPDVGTSENLISGFVRNTKSSLGVKNAALAIASRGVPASATEPLTKQLGLIKEPDVRVAIWQALARTGEPTDTGALIGALSSGSDEETRAAEAALVSIAQKEPDANLASQPFLTAFRANANDDGVKALLLRVLGRIGGSNSMDDLLKNLENNNPMVRNAAAAAFSSWPNAEPMPALLAALPSAKDSLIRTNIINTVGNLAGLAGEVPQEEIAKNLIEAYGKTTDNREQIIVAQALARIVHPSVITFFEELAKKDPRRQSITTPGIKFINDMLARAVVVGDGAPLPIAKANLSPGPLLITDGVVMNWLGMSDHISWFVTLDKPGQYEIQLSQSHSGETPGSFIVSFGKSMIKKKVEKTQSNSEFKSINVGKVQFIKPGNYFLWIRPHQILSGDPLMRLKEVTLKRVGN